MDLQWVVVVVDVGDMFFNQLKAYEDLVVVQMETAKCKMFDNIYNDGAASQSPNNIMVIMQVLHCSVQTNNYNITFISQPKQTFSLSRARTLQFSDRVAGPRFPDLDEKHWQNMIN